MSCSRTNSRNGMGQHAYGILVTKSFVRVWRGAVRRWIWGLLCAVGFQNGVSSHQTSKRPASLPSGWTHAVTHIICFFIWRSLLSVCGLVDCDWCPAVGISRYFGLVCWSPFLKHGRYKKPLFYPPGFGLHVAWSFGWAKYTAVWGMVTGPFV